MELNSLDVETIHAYLRVRLKGSGYQGPIVISLQRLEEIHMENSISIANQAIANVARADNA